MAWTFYYDGHGRTIRTINSSTGAVRSFNYDDASNQTGVEEPLGSRHCMSYDANGSLLQALSLAAPGAIGSATPIRHRYAWGAFPVRMTTKFDPRDPTRSLQTFGWDVRGNLATVTDATGNVTMLEPEPFGQPARVYSPNGAITEYEYDETTATLQRITRDAMGPASITSFLMHDYGGRLIARLSPLGEATVVTWSDGKPETITRDAEGVSNTTQLDYDDLGQLTRTDNGLARVDTVYDLLGAPEQIVAHALDGSVADRTSCKHTGADGRLLDAVLPEGNRIHLSYDGEGRMTAAEAGALAPDIDGTWDDGCAVMSPSPGAFVAGTIKQVEYDANGRPITITDGRLAATHIEYDGFGRPLIVTDPGGGTTRIGYDPMGNILWQSRYGLAGAAVPYGLPLLGQPGLLAVTEYEYDFAGRPVREERWHFDDLGTSVGDGKATTTVSWDLVANTLTVVDDGGATTIQRFDGAGRSTGATLPTGDFVKQSYADDGRTIERIWSAPTPSGLRRNVTHLTEWGGIDSVTTSDVGATVALRQVAYDDRRRPIAVAEPSGLVQQLSYDAFDELAVADTWFDDVSHETIAMMYDRNGNVVSRTSDVGGTGGASATSYVYDPLGRLRSRTRPGGVVDQFEYDVASPLVSTMRDARGVVFYNAYLATGELDHVTALPPEGYGGARVRDFDYDGVGRVVAATDWGASYASTADDVTTYLRWDSLGNRTKEWNSALGAALGVAHSYDGLSQERTSTLGSLGVARDYDPLGRLTAVRLAGEAVDTAQFAYAGLGGPTSRAYKNGVAALYDYDALGHLVAQTESGPLGVTADWQWDVPLDGAPRAAHLARDGGEAATSLYRVDRAMRVTGEDHHAAIGSLGLSAGTSWADADLSVDPLIGSGDEWREYALDGRANWLERKADAPAVHVLSTTDAGDRYTNFGDDSAFYDARGALVHLGDETYEYDAFGELVSATKGATERGYTYDAFGRRIQEYDPTTGTATCVGTGAATCFGYDGLRRAVRRSPGGTVDMTVDGAALDEHLVNVDAVGNRTYLHEERQGSVYLATSATGAPLEWYEYTAFGEPTILDASGSMLGASAIGNRFGYQGQPFDLDLGLVDMRARQYRPGWGRFLSPDPIGLTGGPNVYAFVGGAPLSWRDPLGLVKDGGNAMDAGVGPVDAGADVPGGFPEGTPGNEVLSNFDPSWLRITASHNELDDRWSDAAELEADARRAAILGVTVCGATFGLLCPDGNEVPRDLPGADAYYDTQFVAFVVLTYGPLLESLRGTGVQAEKGWQASNERPVVFKRPVAGATPAQEAQIRAYVEGCNGALCAGALSPAGRVSTKGALRRAAAKAAEAERAANPGAYGQGQHVGHVPDTTWMGQAQPHSWLPLDGSINTSLGSQAGHYPIGYKPTGFWFIDDYIAQFGAGASTAGNSSGVWWPLAATESR